MYKPTPMTINGFTFKACNSDLSFSERYYEATNGKYVITAKRLDYLVRKVKKLTKVEQISG